METWTRMVSKSFQRNDKGQPAIKAIPYSELDSFIAGLNVVNENTASLA